MGEPETLPDQILSSRSSGRRRSTDSNSPEFEFCMLRNPSSPQPNILSADELFSDGFLLPLHLLNLSDDPTPPHTMSAPPEATGSDQFQENQASILIESDDLSANPSFTSSKRWMDIFKKGEKKSSRLFNGVNADDSSKDKAINSNSKEKKREKKNGVGSIKGASAAELNIINIWPFSRSISAGNSAARPRSAAANRKVSSAPCSRSNSRGESKSRKWPSSPNRAGVHLGRSSPVWQVRRGGSGRRSATFVKNPQKAIGKNGNDSRRRTSPAESVGGRSNKARVLSLNVPMCIGYRHQLSCRSDENSAVAVSTALTGGNVGGDGVRGSYLFNVRSLFSKKVY
ncbi:uncharacterized protein [Primulina huaijiensis]|uniref:uncharacterized protein n=1 Tax=Primulina huaijiensis TaxID=1492673 RepID=UPI003CC7527E